MMFSTYVKQFSIDFIFLVMFLEMLTFIITTKYNCIRFLCIIFIYCYFTIFIYQIFVLVGNLRMKECTRYEKVEHLLH